MDDSGDRQALMTALVTEHFVLQTRASSTISEASSRCSLYLLSLSSSLVALGFATQAAEDSFGPFAAALLPTMFLLGIFTVVRLVDTSIENIMCMRGITRIRRYYSDLSPEAAEFFAKDGTVEVDAVTTGGTGRHRTLLWFTMASMIGTVNAVVGGTMVALLIDAGIGLSRTVAIVVGAAVAVGLALAVVVYEQRRFDRAVGQGGA